MVRYRCNIVACGLDLMQTSQDMTRAQPHGDMIMEAIIETCQ